MKITCLNTREYHVKVSGVKHVNTGVAKVVEINPSFHQFYTPLIACSVAAFPLLYFCFVLFVIELLYFSYCSLFVIRAFVSV